MMICQLVFPTLKPYDDENLPLVHMNAGDIIIYHGDRMWHGCRQMKPNERRLQLTLFYQIKGYRENKMPY